MHTEKMRRTKYTRRETRNGGYLSDDLQKSSMYGRRPTIIKEKPKISGSLKHTQHTHTHTKIECHFISVSAFKPER